MEIRTLRYFIAVSEESSLTKAAEKVGISQPALSKNMMELEESLGTKLFVRNSRGTALTETGRVLYDRAREIVAMSDRTEKEVRSMVEDAGTDVYIGLGESFEIEGVSRAFMEVRESLPKSRMHIYSDNADGIRNRLDLGLIDFGIILESFDGDRYDGFRTGNTAMFGLLMRTDDPLAAGDRVAARDLWDRDLIMLRGAEKHPGLSDSVGDAIAARSVASYNLINNATSMVSAGVGVAVTIEWLADRVNDPGLCFRPLHPPIEVESSVVWLKDRRMSATAKAMTEELRRIYPGRD